MINWKPIDQAPLDGTVVLIAAMHYYGKDMADAYKKIAAKPQVLCAQARYSTWDGCWREVSGGEKIIYPRFFNPHAFSMIDPPIKDHYENFQENGCHG
jgi:hypothetical protein